MNDSNRNIRIGILGHSDIARRRFIPAVRRSRTAALTAIGTRDPDSLRAVLGDDKEIAAQSYETLLASGNVDLVYISLPNHLHEQWTLRALEAGKHVLCEKPLGLTRGSVERMTACARGRGLFLGETVAYLHHPVHGRVRELLAADAIGHVRLLRANYGFTLTDRSNYRLDPLRGGGAFHDLARYPLSAACSFLPGREYAFAGYAFRSEELSTGMIACGVTSGGEGLSFSIGFEQAYECRYELIGEKGTISVDRPFSLPADQPGTITLVAGGKTTSLVVGRHDHFQIMIEKACGDILERSDFGSWYDHALLLARLADQLDRSLTAITGRSGA